jgi:hypothetical protein
MSLCRVVTAAYGPAIAATRYGEMGGVGAKRCSRRPWRIGTAAVGGPFAITAQAAGARAISLTVAFRSGWSKQGKRRCASNGSKLL